MSDYYYPPVSSVEESAFDFNQPYISTATRGAPMAVTASSQQLQPPYVGPPQYYNPPAHYQPYSYAIPPDVFAQAQIPFNDPHPDPMTMTPFPQFSEESRAPADPVVPGPAHRSPGYLFPDGPSDTRTSRSTSFASNASSVASHSGASRSASPNMAEMRKWGTRNPDGSWSCAYPRCTSRSTFHRGCDLRKHFHRHTKSLFCRWEGCPQATDGGFSSQKDRARHEAKHNPSIPCEWAGCERMFSRQDNMVSLLNDGLCTVRSLRELTT